MNCCPLVGQRLSLSSLSGCENKHKINDSWIQSLMNSSWQYVWPVPWMRRRGQRDPQLGLMQLPPAAWPCLGSKPNLTRAGSPQASSESSPAELSVDSPCLLASCMSHFPSNEFRIPLFFQGHRSIGQTWEVVSVIPRLLGYLLHPCHQLKHLQRNQVLSQGFLLGAAMQDWLVWYQVLVVSLVTWFQLCFGQPFLLLLQFCPWDPASLCVLLPDGSHLWLEKVSIKSSLEFGDCCCLVAKSFPTLGDPKEGTHKVTLSMGFLREEYWSRLPFPSLGDLPDPGIELASPTLAGKFFTTKLPGKLFHIYFPM